MKLIAEQQKELTKFPPALRALVEREIEAGNSIIEVGHSFPAPPAGAYFKLAKKVTTRPRVSGSGLDFYDRNSSIYSGEFTDAKRFYFVIEPPNPPEPEPDMDAIRQEMAERVARSDAIRRAEQEAERLSRIAAESKRQTGKKSHGSKARREPRSTFTATSERGPRLPKHSVLQSSTRTSAKWLLFFQDARPPQEIQFKLERTLMTLIPPRMESGKLVSSGKIKETGAPVAFLLTFEAALPKTNCYSLHVEASWDNFKPEYYEYYQKSMASWFDYWTRDFMRASPPAPDAGSAERYRELCDVALNAEKHFDSVEAIQQVIVAEMKRGFGFSTAHKEGGTRIYWDEGRFVSSDYGESNEVREFKDEAEFHKYLYQFYEWQTRSNVYPDHLPPFDVWKLILRLQNRK